MPNTYQAPLRQRNTAAFIAIALTSAIAGTLVVAMAVAGAAIGLLLLLAHAMSDPVALDRPDETSVSFRVSEFSEKITEGGWGDMSDYMCRRLQGSFDARDRWYPPGPWFESSVSVDDHEAKVVVIHPAAAGIDRGLATTTVRFRYEAGLWQYCGVS